MSGSDTQTFSQHAKGTGKETQRGRAAEMQGHHTPLLCVAWWGTGGAPQVMGKVGSKGGGFGRGREKDLSPSTSRPTPAHRPGLTF